MTPRLEKCAEKFNRSNAKGNGSGAEREPDTASKNKLEGKTMETNAAGPHTDRLAVHRLLNVVSEQEDELTAVLGIHDGLRTIEIPDSWSETNENVTISQIELELDLYDEMGDFDPEAAPRILIFVKHLGYDISDQNDAFDAGVRTAISQRIGKSITIEFQRGWAQPGAAVYEVSDPDASWILANYVLKANGYGATHEEGNSTKPGES